MQTSRQVREDLVRALRLDLVGPDPEHYIEDALYAEERLPMRPSRWYLTGFLVPRAAPEDVRSDEASQEEMDLAGDADTDADDDAQPDKAAARRVFFPSSIGSSVLVPKAADGLDVIVGWGDYVPEGDQGLEGQGENTGLPPDDIWRRIPRRAKLRIAVPESAGPASRTPIPDSNGLVLVASARTTGGDLTGLPSGTRAVAVFLVNERDAGEKDRPDPSFAFQACLQLSCAEHFVARPDPRRASANDWDDRVADLQYADEVEYATGHGVACDWAIDESHCSCVWTTWIPRAEVPYTEPAPVPDAMLRMEALAHATLEELRAGLRPIADQYGAWIEQRRGRLPNDAARAETARDLIERAERARSRISRGIDLLEDESVRCAFQLANQAMADAARRREGVKQNKQPAEVPPPTWRPFQIAFVLLNLSGISEPRSSDRELVDLLFFPTGGGKTEAYLALAAITLVLRRLRNEGIQSAGVAVLMRYTLRLLTLDQLSRAAGLVCALEQLRVANLAMLGEWPIEIGLWVGRSATPNRMGKKGDQDDRTARSRTLKFKQNTKINPSPIPLENCPWCGTRFTKDSFVLKPNADKPKDLRIVCTNASCDFTGDRHLPIVAVDEPLYRRLPAFIVATVDKFASLPFEARAGALFGLVDRYDNAGFYGAADQGVGQPLPTPRLPPPDLIIQDELHLISGPLGTIAGLYETAIDHFSTIEVEGQRVRPKIVASTATVRRADTQIRALFCRHGVELFPPASPDRTHSFFARIAPPLEVAPRLYVGIAAPGRSLKVVMLRAYIALLAASMRAFKNNDGDRSAAAPGGNPADPYLTLLGYFNALRELGGARRIVEDEVNSRVKAYALRRRVGEKVGLFESRDIKYEVLELTSRVATSKVADAKRRLEIPWSTQAKDERVDVALATNMISVGLDITRLGLMVVLGQPKGSAEYIQSTSRVGRDPARPGLVVTLLTTNKPRDRSHYERFGFYHRTFYRAVEATSVTPFAPRAIDRVLPALVVSLARHGVSDLTPPAGAIDIADARNRLGFLLDTLARRVDAHDTTLPEAARIELRQKLQKLASELLDQWSTIAHEQAHTGANLKYQQYEQVANAPSLLRDPLDQALPTLVPPRGRFKAARSMRDVEPEVLLLRRGSADGT